jgi:anthranilate synthase
MAASERTYVTRRGLTVSRSATRFDPADLDRITGQVEQRRGGVLSSGMEYPGRYSRWHLAWIDPCLEIIAHGRAVTVTALNARGEVLVPVLAAAAIPACGRAAGARPGTGGDASQWQFTVQIPEPAGSVPEEERSRRPSVFSALREFLAALAGPDEHLGLYGAFGYDLAFQFEPVALARERPRGQRDMVLHLPDRIWVLDRMRDTAFRYSYEFTRPDGAGTAGLPRAAAPAGPGRSQPPRCVPNSAQLADPPAGRFARVVELARERFARGDLFEVVPSQAFRAPCASPAAFFQRLRQRNPAPYEFFLNLGDGEYLAGASPEMYVRVTGDRVETCPISGTIARGANALEDAANITALLTSAKEESELTMCTDVDRNDKSRICEPGSVRVIGRRQIEIYSRLIHTVDHVEGLLRPGYDAIDAFLTHMWAVTVTGAPKAWAMQFIEDHEPQPRHWYGGAVGKIGVDGSMNTGLTLRTAQIKDGVATVRAGATLLFESDPAAEERETRLKAAALLETLQEGIRSAAPEPLPKISQPPGDGMRVLLVDHQDSFVHTLAAYLREQGAQVTTLRAGFGLAALGEYAPDLVVLSPGPGRPSDFGCSALLDELAERRLAAFGVCLGLQAMVEHAGGALSQLATPVHGKASTVRVLGGSLLDGLGTEFTAGRYHSLYATPPQVRGGFAVTAVAGDDVVMAIEDQAARRWAVQFHPESILTATGGAGKQVIGNVLRLARRAGARR